MLVVTAHSAAPVTRSWKATNHPRLGPRSAQASAPPARAATVKVWTYSVGNVREVSARPTASAPASKLRLAHADSNARAHSTGRRNARASHERASAFSP